MRVWVPSFFIVLRLQAAGFAWGRALFLVGFGGLRCRKVASTAFTGLPLLISVATVGVSGVMGGRLPRGHGGLICGVYGHSVSVLG